MLQEFSRPLQGLALSVVGPMPSPKGYTPTATLVSSVYATALDTSGMRPRLGAGTLREESEKRSQ